ncbi:protein INCA1-like isoform X2 [Hoplias malabaricus]|uniref:protein INCA1-like isoform X2 n=1 Tax=Hoplias malabaricus TaxID=27720 RepID=UPI003462DECF
MWHQWSSNGLQIQHEGEKAEEYDPFLSFAKRSRAVHRQDPVSQHPALSQYNDSFRDKILRNPSESSFSCDLFSLDPSELACGQSGRVLLETLPSPATLKGRKRRGGRYSAERQATAFTHHITELRRKQSLIDELKGEKWWGSSVCVRADQRGLFTVTEQHEESHTDPHTLPDHRSHTETAHLPESPYSHEVSVLKKSNSTNG